MKIQDKTSKLLYQKKIMNVVWLGFASKEKYNHRVVLYQRKSREYA